MSSCQGELAEESFQVKAVDRKGNVLLDDTVATLRNGFMELWLPRGRTIMLTIQGFNRTARGVIGTFPDSDTCITTFRLR